MTTELYERLIRPSRCRLFTLHSAVYAVSVGHREALLAAARRLLRDKGFARTTARDLVAASNTNLASIGYHFGSKEKLLYAAMEAEFAEWADYVGRLALSAEGVSPVERLAFAWATVRDTFPEHRALLVAYLEAAAQAERSPQVRAQLARHVAAARRRIAELVRTSMPELEPQQAAAVASLVIAVCDGLALQWFLDPHALPAGPDLGAVLTAGLTPGLPGGSLPAQRSVGL